MKEQKHFWIYILELENGYYYTGYTNNLVKRYWKHQRGTAAKYTKSFKPVEIAQCWVLFGTEGTAKSVEALIKRSNRKMKDHLVKNPGELKALISKKSNLDLNIYTFDPKSVEKKALKIGKKNS